MINFSGIITSYNQDSFIHESIESLATQVDELIVVDDCSTDGSYEKILRNYRNSKVIKILRNSKNLGISKSFNRGISSAQHEHIMIQGGDDISLPDRRNVQEANLMAGSNTVLSFCKPQIIDKNGNEFLTSYAQDSFNNIQGISNYFKKLFLEGNTICAPSAAFHKKNFLEIGMFSNNFDHAQDYEAWLKLSLFGDFHFDENSFVKYRIHGSNISREIKDPQHYLNTSRQIELAVIFSWFVDSLSRRQTEDVFKKLEITFNSDLSLPLNKVQLKRLINNPAILNFIIEDCYKISISSEGVEYQIVKEIIRNISKL